ncbi:Hypothetical_protein [Hexamita inflata]|uniref:Hypothetical_protein n=1 Tax=Hexamita inflata TaxID=28002 RepID=A0AA86Q5D9_9EUKA|nr:Hypothetical protein HINF_LOCUS40310 [Hexamita inflata]
MNRKNNSKQSYDEIQNMQYEKHINRIKNSTLKIKKDGSLIDLSFTQRFQLDQLYLSRTSHSRRAHARDRLQPRAHSRIHLRRHQIESITQPPLNNPPTVLLLQVRVSRPRPLFSVSNPLSNCFLRVRRRAYWNPLD